MGKVKVLGLSELQKQELANGHREGKRHAFRKRCQLVLLKEEGRSSNEVSAIVKMCEMSVNHWLYRYAQEGLEGLKTKEGRGRKPLLSKEKDRASLIAALKDNRQSLSMAKAAFEAAGGAKVCDETLRRFLKVLTVDIKE